MRMIYWLGFVVATIPLLFGLASIKWGNNAFGFGLWLSSGWFMLSRLQTFVGGPDPPWTLTIAQRLQIVMDEAKSDSSCCNYPEPEWRILTVSCSTCGKLLDKLPRPDLGRKRMDGIFVGGFRLLLTDGHPTIIEDDNEIINPKDSEE